MWKKSLIGMISLIVIGSFCAIFINDQVGAVGTLKSGAAESLNLGDEVHLGGSAMSDDMHTILAVKDGYVYFLKTDGANNGVLSNYDNAVSYAKTTYKTQLGNIGSAHFSLSGNDVSLISRTQLQNIGIVSGDDLDSSVPKMSDKWWLIDSDKAANRASFVSVNNELDADGGIQKSVNPDGTSGYNDPNGGSCISESTGEKGVLPITAFDAPQVVKTKYVSKASFNITFNPMTMSYWQNDNCSGAVTGDRVNNPGSGKLDYKLSSSGRDEWSHASSGIPSALPIVHFGWRPRVVVDSSGNVSITEPTKTISPIQNQCYLVTYDDSDMYVNPREGTNKKISFKINSAISSVTYNATITGTPTVTTNYCPIVSNEAGKAMIRPYLKVAADDILMRNNNKRTYSSSSTLSTGNFPTSDNNGSYLTLETNTINVDVTGSSGGVFQTKKPAGTIVTLPLSLIGPKEGARYVSAEAIDKNGNPVYGVLKAVSSGTSDSVDIDFSNLLPDGSNMFQITLYLEDAGSKNTAYRSEGTPITVKFIKSDSPFVFTKPGVTNIKIGGEDVKETITTDNTEITTSGDTAVKYTLSGGIAGTGLTVTNDPDDPKGFTISIGNMPNPSLPADFTLTAELETPTSTKATDNKIIHVFQEISDFKWTPVKEGSFTTSEVVSGQTLGHLEVKNGLPKFTYALTSPSDPGYDASKAKDNGNFAISNTPLDSGKKAEFKTAMSLTPGTYYIQCKVTDAYGDVLYTDFTIVVDAKEQDFIYTNASGTELPKSGDKYRAYEEVYAPNKTFQLYTSGNPTGSTVTYQLSADSPTDVITVDSDGTVHILNASMSTQIGKVIVKATSHDPSGTYADKTIELPITIKKATQTVSFAEDPIYATSGKGSVTPVIDAQDISSNAGGAIVEDTKTLISVDSSVDKTIAKTTDGQTITYNYDKEGGIDIPIHVIKQGNRNYEKAEADGTLHIMGPDEAVLIVSDVGEVEYGEHFFIESLQDDSASVNVKYTFTVDDTTYITSPTVNENRAEFDAIKITGTKKVTVTITRTADSEKPLSVKKQITVVPKEIEITIEDKEKLKGEVNPPLTFEDFSDQLVEWNGTKDDIQAGDVKLSTTANQTSPAGDYSIKGDANYLNKTYPNYHFTFVNGTLEVIEGNIEDDWYHMETDDGQPYDGDWTNQDVNIVTDHDEYVNLSKDQSSWNKDFVTVVQEGSYEQGFWMKKDSGAITSEKKETIKIDKAAPKVKSIKAKDSNNKLQDIINQLSGGIFFKPGTTFEITTSDANNDLDVSGTASIAYKIYKQDSDKTYGSPMKQDTLTVTNEKANITISETTGTYKVCVIPTDKAGNEGTESCHEVTLKKINADEDGDGKPDFVDPDGDGCPDVNIKWKDDDGKWVTINGDRDGDKIPDLNIDSDGDGIPDLNVDTDGDGKPDLNLVILKKADWKPTICVNADEDKGIKEEYCTGTSVKPQINVDLDDDGIPDINIDTNGDMKADVNIDSDDDGKANVNINTLETWKPDKNYTYQKFAYDTMNDVKPYLNIDTDGDGRPDVNVDLDDDGVADINIDTNGDGIPDIDIDSTGDGQPDVNVDVDGDGKPDENIIKITEWKPDHNVDDPMKYDTMKFEEKKELEDNGVKVEDPDGKFPMNVTLKVTDVTKDKQSEVSEKAKDLIGEQSVVQVFDVKLLENGKEIQPDGTIKVKIPVKANIKDPSLLILNENGEYEKVDAIFEDGYLIYETDYLGQFTIVGDVDDSMNEEPDTDVKGSYYPGDNAGGAQNVGGALTGDTTNMMMYMGLGCMSIGMMLLLMFKRNQTE